ncbi:hypothetical protein U5A82_02885 [Sphingobium sp. CR2-8]|uniref:DUF7661 family protein n=1 Tax=Sphingobium sp. CR2-8 TaxID=1306534 RepID=UPI002DB7178B|nr:hypothetical protein [Sphingobium sp. CR2-8]MEC3909453.1 hypothetical protein [Sphingobium sp. CR2-8]
MSEIPASPLRFDIYGRYQLEISMIDGHWKIEKQIGERHVVLHDFVIPHFVGPDELAVYLDDILHENSGIGEVIRRIA